MNPSMVTYIGFVVAVLVLMWGAIEIRRRYIERRKTNTKMNTWVPFKPGPADAAKDPLSGIADDMEENLNSDNHVRAHQNGHFSESKNKL